MRVLAQTIEARVSHLRTHRGEHEVDLIVQGPAGEPVGPGGPAAGPARYRVQSTV